MRLGTAAWLRSSISRFFWSHPHCLQALGLNSGYLLAAISILSTVRAEVDGVDEMKSSTTLKNMPESDRIIKRGWTLGSGSCNVESQGFPGSGYWLSAVQFWAGEKDMVFIPRDDHDHFLCSIVLNRGSIAPQWAWKEKMYKIYTSIKGWCSELKKGICFKIL